MGGCKGSLRRKRGRVEAVRAYAHVCCGASRINVYAQLMCVEVLRHSVGTAVSAGGARPMADACGGGRLPVDRSRLGDPCDDEGVRDGRGPPVTRAGVWPPGRAETVRAGSTCPAPVRLLRHGGRSGSSRRGGGPSAADTRVRACARTPPPRVGGGHGAAHHTRRSRSAEGARGLVGSASGRLPGVSPVQAPLAVRPSAVTRPSLPGVR